MMLHDAEPSTSCEVLASARFSVSLGPLFRLIVESRWEPQTVKAAPPLYGKLYRQQAGRGTR
eukprot:6210120-Pleurochrysis_carterae.AAC.2